MKIICPTCGGRGHVFDPICLVSPITALAALFERNDKNGISRQVCPDCKGRKYIEIGRGR